MKVIPEIDVSQGLTSALTALKAGAQPHWRDLVGALGEEVPLDRALAMMKLAAGLLDAGHREAARNLVHRAWVLSGHHSSVSPLHLALSRESGDVTATRETYKRLGIQAASQGEIAQALKHFQAWQYTDMDLHQQDRYVFDDDVLQAIRNLARPHEMGFSARKGGGLRVAHLLFGATHFNSVIMRLAREFARHHDRTRFQAAFFIPEAEADVNASIQGSGHVEFLQAAGWAVTCASNHPDEGERLLGLGRAIRAFAPDILLLHAALADFRPMFLMNLNLAPWRVGLVSGPPPQFAPPDMDWGIAWTWHPLMDAPVPCTQVDLEFDLPEIPSGTGPQRECFDIPDSAPLFAAAGRPPKFADPRYWNLVAQVLSAAPEAYFLAIGPQREDLVSVWQFAEGVADRIRVVPWREDYLAVLRLADLVIDTLPSGGGVALTDAMSLGLPVFSMANDYLQDMNQVEWTPAAEFLPGPEFVVDLGEWTSFRDRILAGLADRGALRALGCSSREHILATRGRPARMVARCEAVLARVVETVAPRQPHPGPSRPEGFLFAPRSAGEAELRQLIDYLLSFAPEDPVRLVLVETPDVGIPWTDVVLELARSLSLETFPEVVVVESGSELSDTLAECRLIHPLPLPEEGPSTWAIRRLQARSGRQSAEANY